MRSNHRDFYYWKSALLLIVLLLASCSRLQEFNVSPKFICPSETVTVVWDTPRGSVLNSQPRLFPQKKLCGKGNMEQSLNQTTVFILKTPDKKFPVEPQSVRVISPSSSRRLLGGDSVCKDNRLVAKFNVDRSLWSRNIKISSIQTSSPLSLEVWHLDRKIMLTGLEENRQLEGLEPTGEWQLVLPLKSSQTCEGINDELPSTLGLQVTLQCNE